MPITLDGTNGITQTTGVVTAPGGSASAPAITRDGDTNTGIYFPSADTLAFAEGGVQVGEFDSSGNFKMNSGYGSVATVYGCRAWVNFNGTGTVAIRASGNVSSITDNGVGDYTVNFTSSITDGNYAFNASSYSGSGGEGDVVWTKSSGTLGTSGLTILCGVPGTSGSTGYTVRDNAVICISVFR